jgi:hypothetical protein
MNPKQNAATKDMGWSVVEDAGRGWRRVVASPLPKEIVEFDAVKTLLDAGQVVITVGGGGIPVIDRGDGELVGTAAVIDKDFASSLLAQTLKADMLLIATAVEKVAIHFGKPEQKWLDKMTVAEAKAYLAEGTHFAKGSMAPKIQAVIWYLENGGKEALITNPESIGRAPKAKRVRYRNRQVALAIVPYISMKKLTRPFELNQLYAAQYGLVFAFNSRADLWTFLLAARLLLGRIPLDVDLLPPRSGDAQSHLQHQPPVLGHDLSSHAAAASVQTRGHGNCLPSSCAGSWRCCCGRSCARFIPRTQTRIMGEPLFPCLPWHGAAIHLL